MTTLYVFFTILLSTAGGGTQYTSINDDPAALNKTLLIKLVNDTRRKGCQCGEEWYPPAPPVAWNDVLEKAAAGHSNEMYQYKFFSHTSKNGEKAGDRLDAAGYRWKTYGENIAEGYETEKDVVTGWLKSEGHCKNIMNPTYKEMGIAKAGKYWTQTFGARLN